MRRPAALLATVLALTATPILLLAAPAQAANPAVSAPDPANGSRTVSVDRNGCPGPVELKVGDTVLASDRTGGALSGTWGGPAVANGSYVAKHIGARADRACLSGPVELGSTPFDLAAAPAAPVDVTSTTTEPGRAAVTWTPGAEIDLTGYRVTEGDGVPTDVPVPCDGSCTAQILGLAGGDHVFTVVAVRSCPTCEGGTVTAATAAEAVRVEGAAAAPGPTASDPADPVADADGDGVPNKDDPTPGASTPGTPGAGTAPGGKAAQAPSRGRTSFGGFSGFGSNLAVPGLKPVEVPSVASPSPDTYGTTLDYPAEIREDEAAPTSRALDPIRDAIDSEQLMRSLAAALVLLLGAAHLRRWLSTARPH